jgi:uncharacterized protein YegP (UPF0339 family)
VLKEANFQMLSAIDELCQKLVKSVKSNSYPLIDGVFRLVLIDSSCFNSNHKMRIFSHESYKNKATQQDGR